MQKKFLLNLILIVALNLLIKPFYILGIDAEIQNRVGSEVYGNFFALLNFSFLLNIVLDLGITNFNSKNIAQNPQLINSYFGKTLSIRFLLFFAYLFLTIGSGFLVNYDSNEIYFLILLTLNQFFVATIQYVRSSFSGLHLFKQDAFLSILDRTLLIIFCAVLLWGIPKDSVFKIEWFIYAQTIAYSTSAIIALLILRINIGKIKLRLKKTFSVAMLKQSLPYALLILLMMFYNRIDSVMIERMLSDGNEQAGVYAQGFRFLDAVNMFALLFAGLMLPIFSRQIKQKESIIPILSISVRTLLPISLTIGITAFCFQNELIEWRYSNSTLISASSFGFLILSFIPICITYIYGTLLTANGNLKQLNIMALFGLILNVILNLILIPNLKSEGAAIATLITQVFTALIQLFLALYYFKIKINWSLLLRIILLTSLVILINIVIPYLFSTDFSNIKLILIVLSLSLITIFASGTLPIKSLISIFKEK
jgi:O-antigen/teichoic acid export membrane protein